MTAKAGKTDKVGKTTTNPKKKDFAGSGVEGQKDQAAEKTIIRGEDVLKSMRAKGVKI